MPWAWAGRHRLPPLRAGRLDRARGRLDITSCSRPGATRPTAAARWPGVLIWAHPAVPDRGRSLAELFRERTEVGLTVYPPGTAPDSADVFDYEEPTTAGPRLLFSVRPVPPEQGAAKELAYERGSRLVTWLVLLDARAWPERWPERPLERIAPACGALWLAVRAPIGPALGLQPLFSPATFFRPLLGRSRGSAGRARARGHRCSRSAASGSGAGACPAAGTAWRSAGRSCSRRPTSISSLGRGITPPADGVSDRPLADLAARAAGLRLGADRPDRRALPRRASPDLRALAHSPLGVAIALAAVDHRRAGLEPARRLARLVHLPVDPGAAARHAARAALGRDHRHRAGRRQLRGAGHLGRRAGRQAAGGPARRGPAGERSPIRSRCRCSSASASSSGRCHRARPPPRRCTPSGTAPRSERRVSGPSRAVVPARRAAGRARARLARSAALAACPPWCGTCPRRTACVLRSSCGCPGALRAAGAADPATSHDGGRRPALGADPAGPGGPPARSLAQPAAPLYRSPCRRRLDPATLHADAPAGGARAGRSGASTRWTCPGGPRTVHAAIDLRGPLPLFVRGVLVVLLDAAVLGLLWFVAELVSGARLPPPRWRSLARSFRIRLAVTLAALLHPARRRIRGVELCPAGARRRSGAATS